MTDPPASLDPRLVETLPHLADDELRALILALPDSSVESLVAAFSAGSSVRPTSPIALAQALDESYRARPHLRLISDALAGAVARVEAGEDQRLIIALPPRSGKTTLCTEYTSAHVLERHPDWSVVLTSHDTSLATTWGRRIRRMAERGRIKVDVAPDAGAVSEWETSSGGALISRSVRSSLTGRGAKVLVIDDPHKDFVEAHSADAREAVWNWWLTVAQTRLEPPSLVVVIMTRWHTDDLVGRLLSDEYEGDPGVWRVLSLPAIAEPTDGAPDPLGRSAGEPLLSPLSAETEEEALDRWRRVERDVGAYAWSALYQQRPAPAEGAIFNMGRLRFWTSDPARAKADGSAVYLDPLDPRVTAHGGTPHALAPSPDDGDTSVTEHGAGRWLDSWDMAFKGKEDSDFVVGQRWLRRGPYRYLIDQHRGRLSFTATLAAVRKFSGIPDPATPDSPPLSGGRYAEHVTERLIEDKANGTAVMSVLRREIAGIVPISPRDGKEARARAVTPEVESGHVLLPHPADPGNEWVTDLLSELREFPRGAHDDQVDALTQALAALRDGGTATLTVPGRTRSITRRPASAVAAARIRR